MRLGRAKASAGLCLIIALVHLVSAGCKEERLPLASCTGTCVTNDGPVPHCVVASECETSLTCPSGLRCLSRPVDTRDVAACPSVGRENAPPGCRLATVDENQLDGLVTGFHARLMELAPVGSDKESSHTLAFRSPPGPEVKSVACALFVCTPEFGSVTRNNEAVQEIKNFDECVVASAMFDHAEGAFDFGSVASMRSKPFRDPGGACAAAQEDRTQPWIVSVLQVGCWGYGETRIEAATLLVPVSPSSVSVPDLVVGTCKEKTGYSCLLDDGTFGTCDEECRRRCVDAHDCLPPVLTRPDPDASTYGTADAMASDGAASEADAGGDADADAATAVEAGTVTTPDRCKRLPGQRYFGVCSPDCENQP